MAEGPDFAGVRRPQLEKEEINRNPITDGPIGGTKAGFVHALVNRSDTESHDMFSRVRT